MGTEEDKYIRITPKFIGVAFAAFVVAISSGPLVNKLSPDARNDPATGSELRQLEDRLDELELEVAQCQDRQSSHRELQADALATIRAKTISNEYLIKQCMGRVGI